MTTERETRLVERFLAREPLEATDPEDAALAEELRRLDAALEGGAAPEPPQAVVARTLQRASAELGAAASTTDTLVEFGRLLVLAALPLPLILAWNAAVLVFGPELLAGVLPEGIAWWVPTTYVIGAAGWLALLYGSLPAVAHRTLARRRREAFS